MRAAPDTAQRPATGGCTVRRPSAQTDEQSGMAGGAAALLCSAAASNDGPSAANHRATAPSTMLMSVKCRSPSTASTSCGARARARYHHRSTGTGRPAVHARAPTHHLVGTHAAANNLNDAHVVEKVVSIADPDGERAGDPCKARTTRAGQDVGAKHRVRNAPDRGQLRERRMLRPSGPEGQVVDALEVQGAAMALRQVAHAAAQGAKSDARFDGEDALLAGVRKVPERRRYEKCRMHRLAMRPR